MRTAANFKGKTMRFTFQAATLAASILILAGCAQNETRTAADEPADTQASAVTAPATEPSPEPPQAAEPALTNPAVIAFDERSTQLDSEAQALVARLVVPARRAGKIVIMGYSDRRKDGNAKDTAIARAVKVRNELVKNGIAAKNIRIKYSTDQGKHMVAVDLGGEPARADNDTEAGRKH